MFNIVVLTNLIVGRGLHRITAHEASILINKCIFVPFLIRTLILFYYVVNSWFIYFAMFYIVSLGKYRNTFFEEYTYKNMWFLHSYWKTASLQSVLQAFSFYYNRFTFRQFLRLFVIYFWRVNYNINIRVNSKLNRIMEY